MGTEAKPYYARKLEEAFAARKKVNPSYSLRAFSLYLGVQAPSLSSMIKGKRKVPRQTARRMLSRLNLSALERDRFLNSLSINPKDLGVPESYSVDAELYESVVAEWEHYALLSLMETEDFRHDPAWMAGRLGLAETRAQECLERLESCGLLRRHEDGRFEKTHLNLTTSDDVASRALRKAHREELEMGIRKLETVPLVARDFSSMTVSISPEKIVQAKELLRKFRREFTRLLEDEPGSEVFQLCLQFYPLTERRRP